MTGGKTDYGRTNSMPHSTLELLSLLGKSMRSSWKRYLTIIIGFAVVAFVINILLIQYDVFLKDIVNQYLTSIYQICNPILQVFTFDLALTYNNAIPSAVLWLLIGFILAIMREQGLKGLKKIPGSWIVSIRDIRETGVKGMVLVIILTIISGIIGIYLNNIVLIFACIITILYTLAARQTGVLLLIIQLLWSDIKKMCTHTNASKNSSLIPLGYPESVLFGLFLGFLGSFFYMFIQLFT